MTGQVRWQTAGDSHGPRLVGILEGLPPGAPVSADRANDLLALRAAGFGRSRRQRLEKDRALLEGGVRKGVATGAPLLVAVENALAAEPPDQEEWRVRPGHADLAGSLRAGLPPAAVAERASGRETAARVAMGAVALDLLSFLGVEVEAWVEAVGAVEAGAPGPASTEHPLRWPDPDSEERVKDAVRAAGRAGTTLGGRIGVRATGMPAGLGEAEEPATRLSAVWPQALFSIPSVRAVELGEGRGQAVATGAEALDLPLEPDNRAGGIEGGRTSGKPLLARAWVKPVPTQRAPLPSVDLATGEPAPAPHVRGDVTVAPAVAVVAEAVTGLVLLQAVGSFLGSAPWPAWQARWAEHRASLPDWLPE